MLLFFFQALHAYDFQDESEQKRPVIVVGSYVAFLWNLVNKKDTISGNKSGINSLTHNIPAIAMGYGDVIGEHIYVGIDGTLGYGFSRSKDERGIKEHPKWHVSLALQAGIHLTPSARVYGLIGGDKTNFVKEQDISDEQGKGSKVIAQADDFAWCVGGGVTITMSTRFGIGFEGRYLPARKWKVAGDSGEQAELSSWLASARFILFI